MAAVAEKVVQGNGRLCRPFSAPQCTVASMHQKQLRQRQLWLYPARHHLSEIVLVDQELRGDSAAKTPS